MSINHFSSDHPDTIWWMQHQAMDPNITSSSHHHNQQLHSQGQVWRNSQQPAPMIQIPNPCRDFNLNNVNRDDEDEDRSSVERREKEAMFEKPLTPSDVGKLNRLVIPKQHAERYFPLGGDSGDKGLLLSFEDESGKCWRFRYSYWNSSQSYVLTKGWSRYVKEKQLDAGDVVFFQRHFRTDGDHFFIGWRRRNTEAQPSTAPAPRNRALYHAHPYPARSAVPYQPDYCAHAGTTTVPAGNNLKRLRLFGVNMEYEPSTPDGSSASQGAAHYYNSQVCAPNHQNQTGTIYSGDVNQRARRGRG